MLSGDKNLLIPGTEAFARLTLQRSEVELLDVLVWPQVHGVWSVCVAALSGRYDVVTVQDPFWRGLLAWVVTRLGRRPLQVQVHTDFARESLHKPLRRMVGIFVLRHATSIRVVTEKIKTDIQQYTHAPVSVLPVFVDITHVRSAQPAALADMYGFEKTILVVARLEAEKNVGQAIACMRAVVERVPGVGLVVVGDGSQRQALEGLVARWGLQDSVRFVGYQKDVGPFYKGADLLLVTSVFESYGAALVEALSVGAPVVSTDVGVARIAAKNPSIVSSPEVWMSEGVEKILQALTSGAKGELALPVLSKEEWATAWKQSLFDTIHI